MTLKGLVLSTLTILGAGVFGYASVCLIAIMVTHNCYWILPAVVLIGVWLLMAYGFSEKRSYDEQKLDDN